MPHDDEDVILPDDYGQENSTPEDNPEQSESTEPAASEDTQTDDTTQTDADTTTSEPVDGGDANPVDPNASTEPVAPKLKIRFNHQDMELDEEQARLAAQKGLNYDKLYERVQQLEKDPARSFLESRAKSSGMTVEQYVQEVEKQEEAERLQRLVEQNVPEEYAKEMLENQKFRERYTVEQEKMQTEQAQKVKQETDIQDFLGHYNQTNGKPWNPQTDTLPPEVWEANQQGVPLKQAYMDHQNKSLQSELAQVREQMNALQTRSAQAASNSQKAVIGSVTSQGTNSPAATDPFMKGFDSYFD
jgi:arsenate reductase-like glutaredoxin family protein